MWRSAAESLARLPPRSGAGSPGAHPLVARVAPSTPLADGRDPIAPLYFEEALSDLKSELASGVPVFQSLLRTYLLDNTHRLTHALLPSPGMTASLEAQEAERLAAVRAKLSPDEIAELIKETKELKAAQVRRRIPSRGRCPAQSARRSSRCGRAPRSSAGSPLPPQPPCHRPHVRALQHCAPPARRT